MEATKDRDLMSPKKPLKVLIAEDCNDDAELLTRELIQAGYALDWECVATEEDYRAHLHAGLDLILSDFAMPGFNGMRALEILQESGLAIPFIIISGTIGEETAVLAMKQGAADFLLKDRLGRLGPAVKRVLQAAQAQWETKRLEAQLIEAQKMEVVGHLASGVAHDFNNILAVIMGCNELVSLGLGSENRLHKYTEEISYATERAASLTRQLLVFSRKQAVMPVVVDMNQAVADLHKMLRRLTDENVEMNYLPAEKAGHVKVDTGYIGQVLMNLVVNARDAMPGGGKITISTSEAHLTASESAPGAPAGSYVLLSVSDTGTGMSKEVQEHLFEAFFTTKPVGKGTGLGLATCQTIVQQCGGFIRVESELGQGTTFKIYFPRVDEPVAEPSRGEESTALPRGSETVMIVEDERSVRHLACAVLQSHGYEVLSASNGQDGLHVARAHQGQPISLVITDVVMPLMGGKIMAEWLQSIDPELKVLFTSGYTDDPVLQSAEHDEAVDFMPKPYTPTTLLRRVRALLDATR